MSNGGPRIGVDLVDCARIRRVIDRHDEGFLNRVFTDLERAWCEKAADPVPHFAARFAAKEAVAKALGTGIGASAAWRDIEVTRESGAAPEIRLHGAAAATAQALGVRSIRVSLSHTADQAIAMVMLD